MTTVQKDDSIAHMARTPSKKETSQERLFQELRIFAEQYGIRVRCEKLSRDLGYRVRSGVCTVNGRKWVIVDRTLPASDRLDLLADGVRESVGGDAAMPAHLQPFFQGMRGGGESGYPFGQ